MYRFIGLRNGRAIYRWGDRYYVNPVPFCGGVMRSDPHFATLRAAWAGVSA